MKKLIFFLPLLFASCSEFKAMMAEETQNIKNERVYFTDTNQEILDVQINGIPHQLFFDTGAGATMLYYPKFTIEEKKKIRERSVYGFDRKTKISSFNYSADTMGTKMFTVKSKYLYVTNAAENPCDSIKKFDGILGSFYDSDLMLELNYQEGYLQFVDHFDPEGWKMLRAEISETSGKIWVEMEINGIKDFFLFDTGNSTMTYINKEVFKTPGNKLYTIELLAKSVGNATTNIAMDVYKTQIGLGDCIFDFPVCIDQNSSRSVLSKSLINKFNWVIDRKNKKAYCKPIDLKTLLLKRHYLKKVDRLLSGVSDGKLIVSYRNFDSEYEVGDEILSVNDNTITPDNICAFRAMLNQTPDWKSLKIKVAKKS